MNERLSWNQIKSKYPEQWVGLSDVTYDNQHEIESALVKYDNKTLEELSTIFIEQDRTLVVAYTTPLDLDTTNYSAQKRMTWDAIVSKYPHQWVGLIDVRRSVNNTGLCIESAIVKYTDKTRDELTEMQLETNGVMIARYTTPEDQRMLSGYMEVL